MDQQPFAIQADYEVPLLRLLSGLPGGQGKANYVCQLFESEYRQRIPEAHRGPYGSGGEPIWRNNVRWCRQALKERGFLQMPRQGIWQISESGQHWLEQNPGASRIPGSPSTLVRIRKQREGLGSKSSRQTSSKPAQPPSSLPPGMSVTIAQLRQTMKVMPQDQFREVWGALYDQLLAAERTEVTTDLTQTELGRRARRRLDEIHSCLYGQTAAPSGEMVCDWIHFCYALDLYREAAALLPYINEETVHLAVYERAKRIAIVCRTKEG